MGGDQVVGDAQAKPHALFDAPFLAAPEEWFENFLLFRQRDAGAVIANANPDVVLCRAGRNGYFAVVWRVFDGVAHQITDDLGQAGGVGGSRGEVGGNGRFQRLSFFLSGGQPGLQGSRQPVAQFQLLAVQLQCPQHLTM